MLQLITTQVGLHTTSSKSYQEYEKIPLLQHIWQAYVIAYGFEAT
ncbi:hypothetical protein APHWI1_0304 [Anaplasma phagocytophilum str. ApWI1]|uniref:Uncharacterized protein n=2 Tax=Anaplasma phagocytophilum TaxID=948 RepID=A0A0F3N7U9_ANAPH|nr:hypothetical protein APHWEB_1212 [Anaplasma phagocytophilum str. Webster]KJV63019.1 hypothetical protein EPHNCH_1124 [Anaplasma phagocytophilum str. NCH-1]KJV84573.1 hypothetical protein APHWI1_0304 [Anaplasma phagocytophilum str. ApWI1]KJV98786.1 hypothetical protein OTSANNIE_1075 [Anaplasma phagocytophilum str. Annie]KJZ98450.1 hypothetical protein APHCR_0309 [Anaplasma phagocytophilum str. CR1007]